MFLTNSECGRIAADNGPCVRQLPMRRRAGGQSKIREPPAECQILVSLGVEKYQRPTAKQRKLLSKVKNFSTTNKNPKNILHSVTRNFI